ncbi:SixA phosphatase family protein [Hyphomonas johnsonii]|uniref:Phosphoglycerate mutase n=1 Tax=Hyphomonas johnsonii MHS-2 TaxID=1280950 RepID=A0A059F9A7_9PROT|nr:histidine phosphatase family protein [Hyphomonas johnsonii]KCZ87141.1 phosphoglycerate mutase [Hyphomonas johnsonii MHS-2]
MSAPLRWLSAFVLACLVLGACTPVAPAPENVIYLVRHAEKEAGDNPSLTEGGHARAAQLADELDDAGLSHIYSTDLARTRETAAPIAAATGLEIETYDPGDLAAFATVLLATPGPTLVVGHSNTTPDLVTELGGAPGTLIDEAAEFDRLYVLRIRGSEVDTELLRYGAPYQP